MRILFEGFDGHKLTMAYEELHDGRHIKEESEFDLDQSKIFTIHGARFEVLLADPNQLQARILALPR